MLKAVQIPNRSIQDPWATAQAVLKHDRGQSASVLAQSGHRVKGTESSSHDVRINIYCTGIWLYCNIEVQRTIKNLFAGTFLPHYRRTKSYITGTLEYIHNVDTCVLYRFFMNLRYFLYVAKKSVPFQVHEVSGWTVSEDTTLKRVRVQMEELSPGT